MSGTDIEMTWAIAQVAGQFLWSDMTVLSPKDGYGELAVNHMKSSMAADGLSVNIVVLSQNATTEQVSHDPYRLLARVSPACVS
jgi:hypothetical protein